MTQILDGFLELRHADLNEILGETAVEDWDLLAAALRGKHSNETRLAYLRQYERMKQSDQTPVDFLTSSNEYYFVRAAYIYGVAQEIMVIVRLLHKEGRNATCDERCQFEDLMGKLRRFPPDPERRHRTEAKAGELVGDFSQLRDKASGSSRRSKRVGLCDLPVGWEDGVIELASAANSQFALAIAVLASTGCRSAEFKGGVPVSFDEASGALVVKIRPARYVEGKSGQPWTEVRVNVRDPGGRYLFRHARACNGSFTVKVQNAQSLRGAVRTYGERYIWSAGIRTTHKISSSSFRHQVGSDLKASGLADQLPAVLGHAVDRTAQVYGRSRAGRRGRRMTAKSANAIRKTAADPVRLGRKAVNAGRQRPT